MALHNRLLFIFFIGAIVVNVAFYDIRSNERFIQQIQQTIMLNSGKAASANTLVENDATSVSPVAVVINDDSYEETSPNDACVIARAMEQHEATLHSYPPLSNVHVSPNKDKPQSVPHLASLLCEEKGGSSYHVNKGPLKNIIAFKAARTGSTFFTTVITQTVTETGRPGVQYWEPFNSRKCGDGPTHNVTQQAHALRTILNNRCERVDKCRPTKQCETTPQADDTVYITASNPRWLNPALPWPTIMAPDGASRIFALRRTNLVLMAYSKYHHGGCDVFVRQGRHGAPKIRFDLDMLLRCVEHYTLWEQEYSSSAALQITSSVLPQQPWPFLVVYEDV